MMVITGATGDIGGKVLRRLSRAGIETRALSRDPSRGEDLPGVTWAESDLSKPETLPAVFEGATTLFLLTGVSAEMVEIQTNAVEAAREAGTRHIVKLSALGATPRSKSGIGRWHYDVEEAIREAGMTWTMLRPHVFMQNLLGQAERIREQGEIRASSGEGQIPFIDTRDIADAAVAALAEGGHERKTFHLTGGAALTYGQVAAILGAAMGQEVRYVDETDVEARKRLRSEGLPGWQIDGYLTLAAYQREGGQTARITRDVYETTGHAPRSMVQFAYDHAGALAGG